MALSDRTHVLIVGSEGDARRQLVDFLAAHAAVSEARDAAHVLPVARRRPVDVVVATSDALTAPDQLVAGVKAFDDSIEVVAIVDAAERGHGALEQGAYDFLLEPVDYARLGVVLRHVTEIAQLREKSEVLTQQMEGVVRFGSMVACDPRMIQLFNRARRLARYRAPVLITGERGTGKESLARALHELGDRGLPFVTVTATMSLEEFDRAYNDARGGTLFIADTAALMPAVATRLTSLLDRPTVNGDEPDAVRIVIARETRRDERADDPLTDEIERRIGGGRLAIPPLRERRMDLRVLAREIVAEGGRGEGLAPELEDALAAYEWPGNVDELRDILSAATRAAGARPIDVQDLPSAFQARAESGRGHIAESRLLRDIEVQHLRQALLETHGNKARAARILGLSRWALQRRMQKHGIRMEDVVPGGGGQSMRDNGDG